MSKTTDLAATDVPVDPALVRARMRGPLGSLAGVPFSIGMCIPVVLHLVSLDRDPVASRLGYGLMAVLYAASPLLRRYERRHVGTCTPRVNGTFLVGAMIVCGLALPLFIAGVFIFDVSDPWSGWVGSIPLLIVVAFSLIVLWHRAWSTGRRGWWPTALALACTAGMWAAWALLPGSGARLDVIILVSLLGMAALELLSHLELRGVLR